MTRPLAAVAVATAALLVTSAAGFVAPRVGNVSPVPSSSTFRRAGISSSLSMSAGPGNGGVVITGAAGGVGFAYAGEFMDRGFDVVICDVRDCSTAARALEARHPNGRVFPTKCDVSDQKQMEKLGKFAVDKMGTIEHWINNAGVNGGRRALMDVPMSQVELVVKVNLLGVLLGTKVAMDIMKDQVSSFSRHWEVLIFDSGR